MARSAFNTAIFFILAVALAAPGEAATVVPADDPGILYTGRWDQSDPSEPWAYAKGTSIIARFEGSSIAATLGAKKTDYFRIIVDGDAAGSTKIPVDSGTATYLLASGLVDGPHTVEIVKETDQGRCSFYGFELDDGKTLAAPPARPARRIEFYGDSNLAGYSLQSELNESGLELQGSYYGYAGITSRMFDAEYSNVSRSGATIGSLHDSYDQIDWRSRFPAWEFSRFPADVVVVNIGANDAGRSEEENKAAYHALLDDLRAAQPDAHIMLFNAWGWSYTEPANYTHEVIAERDDPNISSAVFPWIFEQWHGCEYDHGGMAQVLAAHVGSVMGWVPRPADVMSGYGVDGDVANGGFEETAPFGGYGWRYYTDAGVRRVFDPSGAREGERYLRLADGAASHQPIPANDGESFTVTAWMRGAQEGDQVHVTMDFRDQEMWTDPLHTATETMTLTTGWQQFSMTATAPTGAERPVYHTRLTFTAASGSTVDVDDVVESRDAGSCGDGSCDSGEDSCNCPADCGSPPLTETGCSDGEDDDCDGLADCADADCAGNPACLPACDSDGSCEAGEDCVNCPGDCDSKSVGPAQDRFCCGNGICEGDGRGYDEISCDCCPVDCGSE